MTRQKLGHSGHYRGTRGWNKPGPKENGRTFGINGATKDRKYREQVEETDEELQARQLYYSWKKMIKEYPKPNDRSTIKALWRKSLEILDNRDLNMIQQLPRDLESIEYQGFNHINAIMGIQAREGQSEEFINLALPFLQVITHEAILDNLAVDTAVGGIYNYISGTNGTRVTTFFQRLCQCIFNLKAENLSVSNLDQIMISILNTLREVLKRERRASFNEDLPKIFDQIERIMKITGLENDSAVNQIVNAGIIELRGIVTRAHKLLQIDSGIHTPESSTVVTSMYSRENARYPRHLHNNDKLDINEMQILPTSEEIQSEHADFLPSTSFDEAHFLQDKAQRHIDTHFRLLRHDIFGQLKETLGGLIFAVRRNPALLKNPRLGLENNFRANIYPNAKLVRIIFQRQRGLEAQISVPNPPNLRNKSKEQKSRWWEESRRLEEGILLCLLSFCDAKCSLLFLIASKKNPDPENNKFSQENSKTIMATLASKNEENLQTLIEIHGAETETNHNFLIELPNVIPATFIPVLECLQRMYRSNRLPFRDWILPDSIEPLITPLPILIVPPPLYARSERFRYSLKPILKDPNGEDILVDPQTALRDEDLLKRILSSTLLDQGQARSMISALCQEFVQIQGPPGTGKSFLGVKLMQVFLEVSRKIHRKLGPIIVVCYTNHALDQFLEHLMEIGIEKIVRIGGQSKSEGLEGKNLRIISKIESKSKGENYTCAMAYKELENKEKEVVKYLKSLQKLRSRKGSVWNLIEKYLRRSFPSIYFQFSRIDDEAFRLVGREPYDLWIQESEAHICEAERTISIERLLETAERNAFSLSVIGRQRLHNFWTSELRRESVDNLYGCIESSKKIEAELRKIHNEVDRRVLQNAEIIGVTTSGLARNISTLEHVRAKVMICEEAGEIIEAHYLTSLLPTVEHVMSIGDHMQLRPSINNYNLSLENPKGTPFQLDRSQFERLSIGEPKRPKLPISQLNIQRRMRPAISNLIRGLYRNLIDHESVKDLPNVVGLKDNVFFFDHKNPEDGSHGDNVVNQKSHSNMWEVEMTFALVRHLIRQGEYKTEDIAVLTPYTGQLQKLRAILRSNFEVFLSERDENLLAEDGFLDNDPRDYDFLQTERVPLCKKKISDLLRLATVDNFQGEEAKIVIVSLVRSNNERRVGFLRTTNRINVLLSRAKHGLYLIGNAETYSEVPMWTDVLEILRAQNSVGSYLRICCPRHTNIEIRVESAEDFEKFSPEGGCRHMCEERLHCGHQCMARCHSKKMHSIFSCQKPCERLHKPCMHKCQKATCGEDCGLCNIKIDETLLPCGHTMNGVACHRSQNPEKIKCNVIVKKKREQCGHDVEVPCSQNVSNPDYVCQIPCITILPCGHKCPGTCSQCKSKLGNTMHKVCNVVCGRLLSNCNHACRMICHNGTACGACTEPCQVKCGHSKCSLPCKETCAPCLEPCLWRSCEHTKETCTLPCAAPCTRLPCQKRCEKILSKCEHQCPSLCGEICPEDYCQVCSTKRDARVDLLMFKNYDEIDLDETPIVVLNCGHFFTVETLDGMLGMHEVYEIDGNGNFIETKEATELARSIPRCPDCNTAIRQYATKRYNRVVNRAVIDNMSKRFLVEGQDGIARLHEKIKETEKSLELGRESINIALQDTNPARAHLTIKNLAEFQKKECQRLLKQIKEFQRKVADENQPAKKLFDATIKAAENMRLETKFSKLSIKKPVSLLPRDLRVTVGAQVLELDAKYHMLIDQFLVLKAVKKTKNMSDVFTAKPECSEFFGACKVLFETCREENLPRRGVDCAIYYGQVAREYNLCNFSTDRTKTQEVVIEAKELLREARRLCEQPFQGADELAIAIDTILKHLQDQWYEEVTPEEKAAIMAAMVSGSQGIASHSGHWYECARGHPCGMPMELARCPECGSTIGGQHHRAVSGVTRSYRMEGIERLE